MSRILPASADSRSVAIKAIDLVKTFRTGQDVVQAVRGVSLEVRKGEIVSLEGPSGSGKTTLLCILGCMLSPDSGRLFIDDLEVKPDRPKLLPKFRREAIGFVFQQFNLFPALNVTENIVYALRIKGVRGAEARREAARVIQAVGLEARKRAKPRELSGGQKQRVAIARALAGPAKVILADEPTANLDAKTGAQILDLFRDLARQENRAVIIVTHDPKVRRVSDRVCRIEEGLLRSEDETLSQNVEAGSIVHAQVPIFKPVLNGKSYPPNRELVTIAANAGFLKNGTDGASTKQASSLINPVRRWNEMSRVAMETVEAPAPRLAVPVCSEDHSCALDVKILNGTNHKSIPIKEISVVSRRASVPKLEVLPSPWTEEDVGGPEVKGSTCFKDGRFILAGSGLGFEANRDQYHSVERMLRGNGSIVAQVKFPAEEAGPTIAGVMIRASSDDAAPFVGLVHTQDGGVFLQSRITLGADAVSLPASGTGREGHPFWLRLDRSGDMFTALTSQTGHAFDVVGSVRVTMGRNAFIGLMVAGNGASARGHAEFDHVSLGTA